MNIYVGNLPYDCDEDKLQELFEKHGEVSSATIINDRDSGRSKGFGFVEMPVRSEAEEAMKALDGYMVPSHRGDRAARVNEARPRKPHRKRDDW